ncbi:MAG: hybrid sensor histidine kinase/response regulator [Proteobacteria bacterium]|nr:hybrid sensor histidine kinase/response regulator [Pseudomonadota bacterium]
MFRVLHIEDDEGSRLLVRKVLTAAGGFVVVEAADGISGIRKALETEPHIILLDIKLPDMDGYEVTLKLRGELSGRNVPIVALTGQGNRDMSLAVGCDGYILKPIDISQLPREVLSYIQGKREKNIEDTDDQLLMAQGQKLAARLQVKIEELEDTNKRLIDAEKVRAEFYRNLSHELSTPLTPAIGYISMLLREELGPLNNVQRRSLKSVERSYQRVRAVIENLLDMTALATGKMSFFARHYDFNQLARESLDLCMHQFDDHEITVETLIPDDPYRAFGDPDKLKRAMVQLLENAMKFCRSYGRVHVATRLADGQLSLLVYDSGKGIPENELQAIFTTFYQIDGSPTREHGGTGLGLALARKIIERFGGMIWAESPPRGEEAKILSWAKTLVALRVPEIMSSEVESESKNEFGPPFNS